MNHYATSPKWAFWKKLAQKRMPIGYQAGLTLNKIERDMVPYQCDWSTAGVLHIKPKEGFTIEVTERVKTLFMAFIVYSRFAVSGHCDNSLDVHIEVKTTGSLRKKSICFISKQPEGQLFIDLINQYPVIRQTLEELDFNRCTISIKNGIWQCEIEPFTASEMVSRIPATRRYLRLTQQQRHRLLSALKLVNQLMEIHFATD
ncbi:MULTISPECIES: DUF3156 family protein [Providencia]|uniref:DUF3156 family protein n=1 Tax=Providencia TaxID=586 RepID=UPI000B174756|nr:MULTISPECIES: DUF3156 family protein [Providencia]